MHADFWIMTLLMTVVALLFVLAPLARAKQRRTPALLVATIPAVATLSYLALGSPGVTSATPHAAGTQPGERSAHQVAADDAAGRRGVAGRVSLSPAAQQLVQADDTVFIFARPPGQAGAPVAVTRKPADTWPLEFRLTDAQSMTNGVRLSDYEQVIVTARVSPGGDAGITSRALEAKSQAIDVASNTPVHLTIN